MAIDIIVPAPGESVSEVTIANWLKSEGEWVNMDEPIAEFESDKATFEVNAEKAGIIEKLIGTEGDTIAVGTVIAVINDQAVKPASAAEPAKTETPIAAVKAEVKPETKLAVVENTPTTHNLNASPVALQLLSEYGLTNVKINGTGGNGRITKIDVLEYLVKNSAVKTENITTERTKKHEKMSNLRKTISRRLVAVKNETAMLTTFNEVDMKPIMDLRGLYKTEFADKFGVGLGFMSFFTRACCIALQEWPAVNASIDGEDIVYHSYCDISVAVSAPKGLMVPVIRDAQNMSLDQIEAEVKRLATRARDGKLGIDEMTGGTFTITNGGVFGSMLSTPIINAPQSGILGMHNIVERAMVVNGQIVIRPIMYVALSYDHRIIDGKESVSFLVRVKQLLENPEWLIDGKKTAQKLLGL